jgi:flavin-dependent dehydrogenase
MTDFDVIVVGGGPAGSIAAYEAAKAGLKTILLEKDRDIGYPSDVLKPWARMVLKNLWTRILSGSLQP